MAQKLSEYKRKRDPKETPEPFGAKRRKTKEPIFVVQRHDARRLHYDFRLERNGALASWAVPKGVPLEPGQQDLAARFELVAKEIAKAAKTPDCVLDGEVCALDESGRSSFSAMQQGKSGTPLVFYVFDLLELEGEPLVDLPLVERRKRLAELLDKRNRTVRLSEAFDDGAALLQAATEQ